MKVYKVVCGIINHEDKIFIARRKKGKDFAGKWEFPGGKIEIGESEQNALKRELKEELGMNVNVQNKIAYNLHEYETFKINLIAFKCDFISAKFQLIDHDQYKWVLPEHLKNYELAEADLPFIDYLLK